MFIVTVAKIISITIVITNATKVIPFSDVLFIFLVFIYFFLLSRILLFLI